MYFFTHLNKEGVKGRSCGTQIHIPTFREPIFAVKEFFSGSQVFKSLAKQLETIGIFSRC